MTLLKERLIELLINNKLITQDQLNEALDVQQQKGGRLSDIIVSLKFIKDNDLMSVLSQGLGFPLIDLRRYKIEPEIVKIIPYEVSKHYQIVSISKVGNTVTLAMADPLNIFALDHVKTLTGYNINPIISTSQDILQALESAYPDNTKDKINDLVKEIYDTSIELIKEEKEAQPSDMELNRISNEAPVIKVTNMVIEEAVKKKVSDILIEPMSNKLRVRFRCDGVLREQPFLPKNMHAPIISRIKVMSELNISEHRLPQDGRFKVSMLDKEIDFRISVLPSSLGEKIAIRILDKSANILDIDKLGFATDVTDKLKKMAVLPHGMILVCGPTGSGKTTTLYSILKFVDSPQKNIVTVEDPVEFQLEGINQVTARPDIGLTFASALRSILRQDPNIIMIGEIRDFETVDIAIKSALTGHLVLSTLHTTTASGAVVRLVNMGVDPYLLNAAVIGLAAQRLLRKVCSFCKEKYSIDADALRVLGIVADKNKKIELLRGKGCSRCYNSGYSGRLSIAEVIVLTPKIRELILSRQQEHVIRKAAREEGMKTLREQAVSVMLEGIVTLDEVIRVTASD